VQQGSYTAREVGEFTTELTGLSPQQMYSVRAYVITDFATSWGETIIFTTTATPPEVITLNVIDITSESARANGEVTHEGSYEITIRGFVWGTNQIHP
jgi:hypothetical protein